MINQFRLALRTLAKSPGFTTVAVLMLALGIGASTACFSFLNAFFLRPPPFTEPDRLVSLHMVDERTPGLMRLSAPNFDDYRAHTGVFHDIALHTFAGMRYQDGDQATTLFGELVTASYFEILGVKPVLGRLLRPDDDRNAGAPPVIVVSHAFWQERLGADPAALGRPLVLNRVPFTIVGVAPAGFRGVNLLGSPAYWVPASAHSIVLDGQALEFYRSRRSVNVNAIGRLLPGVTLEQAEAALKTVAQGLATTYPADNAGRSIRLVPIAQAMVDPNTRSDMRRAGNLLIALSGLVLLIACANLANLLLARSGARQREIAMRIALGAGRRQVVSQLLRENSLLATLGGVLGLVLAHWFRDLLWLLRPRGFPDSLSIALDGNVIAFALLATLLTGLAFGLVPALSATRVDLVSVIKRDSSGGGAGSLLSFRHLLVAAQVALSMVALVIAGLFLRSLHQANIVELGWNNRNLAMLFANLQREGYTPPRALQYYDDALARLRAVPGVVDASFSSRPFLTGANPQRTIRPQGAADETLRTRGQLMSYACVYPGFLRFMGVPLVAGRDFTVDDNADRPPVVIVNEAFVRRAWPGEDPLGKTVKLYNNETPVQVVGVVRDVRDVDLRGSPAPFVYFPLRQLFVAGNTLHVRVAGDAAALLPTLRKELQSLDPAVSFNSASMDDLMRFALWGPRTGAALMSVFGGMALLLTSLGIYAVMAHAVGQRTREIGIRLAIGAQAGTVLGLVLRRGLAVVALGLAVGLGAAYGLTRYVGSFLFEVNATDPLTFAAIAMILGAVALIACYVPARRATKVDPLVALRTE